MADSKAQSVVDGHRPTSSASTTGDGGNDVIVTATATATSNTSSDATETTALLLPNSRRGRDEEEEGDDDGGRSGTQQKSERDWDIMPARGDASWRRELKIMLTSAGPLIVTFFLQFSINATSVFAVGRMGKQELAAVALANMTASMTCLAPFIGLATSLDTLCAQAYGQGRKHLVGLQCQRMVLFLLCFAVPVSLLWALSGRLLAFIVDAETARLAGVYLTVLILSIPAYVVFESGKRILQAQGLFRPATYMILAVAPVNMLVSWLLVWRLGMGFVGAPAAIVVSRNLLALLLVLYVRFVDGAQCWGGLDLGGAMTNWAAVARLALPGMLMVLAEWLSFELMTLLASRFGTDYLAAQSAIFTIVALVYQVPLSLSVATSTRIASLIGGGVVDSAKLAAKLAVIAAFVISSISVAVVVALRWWLPLMLTRDEGVIAIMAETLPVVALTIFWDGVSSGAHGLLRGIGRQSVGGPANLFSHYVVGVPISLTLAFRFGWEIKGLWTGITFALVVCAVIEYWYVVRADWHQAAAESRARNAQG